METSQPRILAAWLPDEQGLTFPPAAIVAYAPADKHQKNLQLTREVELLPRQKIYWHTMGFSVLGKLEMQVRQKSKSQIEGKDV